MAIAVAEAARARGPARSCSSPPPTTAPAGTARPAAVRGQRRFCDPDVDDLPRARRRAARLGGRARRRARRRRRAQRPRRARRAGWRRSPPTPTRTASCATSTRTSSRASWTSAAPSTASRRSSCSHRTGFLGPRTSLIHGIHVDAADVARLAESDTIVVSCPTTEGSLGDGHFPALVYRDAGVRIAIGSDSHVRVDPFEETRELETLARRERRTRHALLAAYGDLWGELAANGRASLGLDGRGHDRGRPRPPRPGGRRRRRPAARASRPAPRRARRPARLARSRRRVAALPGRAPPPRSPSVCAA